MAKLTKKQKQIREIVEFGKVYPIAEAIEVLKQLPKAKFLESIDVSVNLGIDPRKSDQVVRGATIMPHGTGQEVRVAVFAQGPNAEAAKAAGADVVGFEDLAESIKAGNLDFDVVIATPDAMRIVGQLGQILGPRGLMPNPRVGTVTPDVATAVANEKSGQVRFRADKAGILHCSIGKIDFESNQIHENLGALLAEVRRLKPASSKGIYVKKVTISTTMGPGLSVDVATI
ncbi:50S ribosomal protein L1 [Ignatzschineria sp. RMDPL8A]|uniref:50S ribosomal protein L1 n=1 Tax=Ignatzschineria sp. RMDPL8A TaxID=2999236 RepID=UPI0016A2E2D2|nr:50S ribosomal protein L1 [Ignatzschineria sp. RMDPL8A]MDG9729325.1 50S ribosomal protein L1 [Ignatzschineria sp. RMDPL8A]NLD09135.1 50S ribosomal protein L1 [Xanthomonadaceae bacterium]